MGREILSMTQTPYGPRIAQELRGEDRTQRGFPFQAPKHSLSSTRSTPGTGDPDHGLQSTRLPPRHPA